MYGQDILCPHKISCPYIERYDFHTAMKFEELLN